MESDETQAGGVERFEVGDLVEHCWYGPAEVEGFVEDRGYGGGGLVQIGFEVPSSSAFNVRPSDLEPADDQLRADGSGEPADGVERLDELEKGDRFRVDCHDETLRVHSDGPFGGPIVCDAYDDSGAQWPVAEFDGQFYLGWSQTTPADDQSRAKQIGSVTIVDGAREMRADGSGAVDHLEDDWSEHWPTDPRIISSMRDGFTIRVNGSEVHFRCRDHFPMLVEISIGDEKRPLGAINTAKEETVALGGVSEGLADQVDEIRDLPVEEIPDELEKLAYRLNPAGREDPEASDTSGTDPERDPDE